MESKDQSLGRCEWKFSPRERRRYGDRVPRKRLEQVENGKRRAPHVGRKTCV